MKPFLCVPLSLAALAFAPLAYAAGPSTSDCLAATETSLALRNAHKLRDARRQLLVCAAPSCPSDVRADCTHGVEEMNAAIPTVVFTVKGAGGQELTAVKVTMDGEVVADHLDGTPLTLDPGSHTFTFTVAGQPVVSQSFVLHEGERARRETIVMVAAAPPSSGLPAVPAPLPVVVPVRPVSIPAAPPPPAPEPPAEVSHASGHNRKILAFVVGGTGVAGLAVGGIFGGLAASSWSSVKNECPTFQHCPAQTANDHSSAVTSATVSTIGLIAGGVLLAGGVVLYFTAPKDSSVTTGLEVGPRGLALNGVFW